MKNWTTEDGKYWIREDGAFIVTEEGDYLKTPLVSFKTTASSLKFAVELKT